MTGAEDAGRAGDALEATGSWVPQLGSGSTPREDLAAGKQAEINRHGGPGERRAPLTRLRRIPAGHGKRNARCSTGRSLVLAPRHQSFVAIQLHRAPLSGLQLGLAVARLLVDSLPQSEA